MWRLKYHASIPQFEPYKVHPNTFPLIHKYNPLQKCNDRTFSNNFVQQEISLLRSTTCGGQLSSYLSF